MSKVFISHSRTVAGKRLDPEYHYALASIRIESPYPCVKLLSLAYFKTGGTPSTINGEYWGGDLPWVSAKDFKTFRFEDSEDHITELAAKEATTYVVDKPALLMVSRSGILQHSLPVMVTYKRAAINQDIKAFFPDGRVSVDYLGAYFDLLGNRLLPLLCKSGATVQSINTNELMNLQVPVPPPDVQRQLVAELDAAYAAKRKADEKAAELLASIDDIILDALGIPPIPPADTSLAARIFTVSAREVADKTLAPSHYREMINLGTSKFNSQPFSDVVSIDPVESITNAARPYHLVPMEAVSAEYGCVDRVEVIDAGDMSGYSIFRDGDVICAKISPCMENGKSAVVSTGLEGIIFGSTEFLVFRPKAGLILPEFLHLIIRLGSLRECAGRNLSGTTGHQRITKDFFRALVIPVPPRAVQEKIAAKVASIRAKAKRLKVDALSALVSAKKRIESEIIGGVTDMVPCFENHVCG